MKFICKVLDLIEDGYEVDFRPDTSAGWILIEMRKYSQALKKEFAIRNIVQYRDLVYLRDFESDEYMTNVLTKMETACKHSIEKEINTYAEN